jgi:hypothetical protein
MTAFTYILTLLWQRDDDCQTEVVELTGCLLATWSHRARRRGREGGGVDSFFLEVGRMSPNHGPRLILRVGHDNTPVYLPTYRHVSYPFRGRLEGGATN